MDGSQKPEVSKEMFNTARRSAISTSELGLYSDHSDQYNTNVYGATVRKLVIGIMVVVSIVLIGIFLYDFASSASVSSKVSQETKHIYILQNSLRKPSASTKKPSVTLAPTIYIVNSSYANGFKDRSDDRRDLEFREETPTTTEILTERMALEPESRTQNLNNFKIHKSMIDRQLATEQEALLHNKQISDNHAMIYRMSRQKYFEPEGIALDITSNDAPRESPFQFELHGQHPTSFKRPRYPQLSQYRYPQSSRNIQDIIKYLTNDPETLNRGIKFTGYYVSQKKHDTGYADIGEVAMNSDRSEEHVHPPYAGPVPGPYAISYNGDPLYQYKPKHPSEVNLLAPTNFRFSPLEMQRYNTLYDSYYQRPNTNKHSVYKEGQNESFEQKRKPKPFSLMLDIYPMTDATEHTKKFSKLKPQIIMEETDSKKTIAPFYSTPPKFHRLIPTVITAQNQIQQMPQSDTPDEERHQMILHLNLYPKRKAKVTSFRNTALRSDQVFESGKETIDRMLPFDEIAKHLTDHHVEAKLSEDKDFIKSSKLKRDETVVEKDDGIETRRSIDESVAQKLIDTTQSNTCDGDCEILNTTQEASIITMATTSKSKTSTSSVSKNELLKLKNSTVIDTIKEFQHFADSLIAMD